MTYNFTEEYDIIVNRCWTCGGRGFLGCEPYGLQGLTCDYQH